MIDSVVRSGVAACYLGGVTASASGVVLFFFCFFLCIIILLNARIHE